jgi:hypothetical protein
MAKRDKKEEAVMNEHKALQQRLQRTLAFAHAALEEPTPERVTHAQRYAREVLPQLSGTDRAALTLGEARHLLQLVTQLRTVLLALEQRMEPQLL